MNNYDLMLEKLENRIKKHAPTYELRFKNESTFMKILGKILFFNKSFMTGAKTTIGTKIYWPSRAQYERDPKASFKTLAHEFVHVMDYIKSPVRFVLGYLFPQILAAPAVLFVLLSPILIPLLALGVLSPWVLLVLLTAVFLAPMPSPGRKKAEMRGYGMSSKARVWLHGSVHPSQTEWYIEQFIGPSYYYMWPFKKSVQKELKGWADPFDVGCLNDSNPAYKEVYDLIKE
jgi:hypothetical protein